MRFFIILSILMTFIHQKMGNSTWDFRTQLEEYFKRRVGEIERASDVWMDVEAGRISQRKVEARSQLLEMLGLNPLPAKTSLNVTVNSIVEYEHFTVENIVFESMPGLYVTANLYRPRKIEKRLPAILYVCGHATVIKDGYNYGAKAHYQHHPAWYARNGYICLILDTVQLAEIEGVHHGLYRYNRWWWMSRGYTPAGIEAWNGIRAIDYLVSRSDVDPDKLGMTGRSGGGATSWWVGALDDRIKVIAPVAGITDLHNHVVDGCVEGHCDCMYFPNTYEWDFPTLGLLFVPRPLLIANADQDGIFPLDGVYRTYTKMKALYDRSNASDLIALNIVGGGHKDIQDIQIPTFRWFNHFLKEEDVLIDLAARKYLEPEKLRALDKMPENEINTSIDEKFVPAAPPLSTQLKNSEYRVKAVEWKKQLREHVFRAWPENDTYHLAKTGELKSAEFQLEIYHFRSEENIDLPLLILKNRGTTDKNPIIQIIDDSTWINLKYFLQEEFGEHELWSEKSPGKPDPQFAAALRSGGNVAFLPMRGSGIASYRVDERSFTHIRRRYFLLGETLESVQTYDIRQGLTALNQIFPEYRTISSSGETAVQVSYALIDKQGYEVHAYEPNISHQHGPQYLNILKYMDVPAAFLMCSEKNVMQIYSKNEDDFSFLRDFAVDHKIFGLTFLSGSD